MNWVFMTPTPGTSNIITNVENDVVPQTFSLSVFPNPFNPSTTIQYQIPERSEVKVELYDLLGRTIWSKFEGIKGAGIYELKWDGVNHFGARVSSGIYLLRLEAGTLSKFLKLMMLK